MTPLCFGLCPMSTGVTCNNHTVTTCPQVAWHPATIRLLHVSRTELTSLLRAHTRAVFMLQQASEKPFALEGGVPDLKHCVVLLHGRACIDAHLLQGAQLSQPAQGEKASWNQCLILPRHATVLLHLLLSRCQHHTQSSARCNSSASHSCTTCFDCVH